VSHDNSINRSDKVTVSAWIKADDFNTTGGVAFGAWVWRATSYALVFDASQSKAGFLIYPPSGEPVYYQVLSNTLTAGQWYHVAGIFDGSEIKIYINGKYQRSTSYVGAIRTGSYSTYIGGLNDSTRNFDGIIDDVKIYGYALTEDEIEIDYNGGKSLVMGARSTISTGAPDSSAAREYCVPGDPATCTPPVAEWKFDEKTGGTVNDTSGNGYNGTWGGTGTRWTTGKFGSGGSFNGVDDYVSMGYPGGFFTTGANRTNISIEAWVKPIALDDWQTVYHMGGQSNCVGMGVTNTGSVRFLTQKDGIDKYIDSPTALSANQWFHLTGTKSETDGMRLYINGVLVGTNAGAYTWDAGASGQQIGRNAFYSGSYQSCLQGLNNYAEPFQGQIDHVRIYDYGRTPAQVAWSYNRGKPIGHWKFDECQGTQVDDWSGNANHGTITIGGGDDQDEAGTCTSGDDTHAWNNGASGKWNSSLNFDGSDDYVNMGDPSELDITGAVSLSAWIKPDSVDGAYRIVGDADGANCGYPCGGYSLTTNGSNVYFEFGDSLAGGNSGNWDQGLASNVLTAGSWAHVVGTWDGTTGANGMKMYVNGRHVASATAVQTVIAHSTPDLAIGARHQSNDVYSGFFPGQIDDVRIYNYASTDDQVQQVMNENAAVRFGE